MQVIMFPYRLIAVFALIIALVVVPAQTVGRTYDTNASRKVDKLNVHLVCHTHDDSGWLKTVDQYHYGSSQWWQNAGVQYILDTVVTELELNPDRKFSYAEMAFFTRWWREQPPHMRKLVKRLVKSGQLDFVNGGYVQHDEAAAHYVAMIDQTTLGHRFLMETFGFRPTVGWQLDPFGHSATHASLICPGVGYDALFFGRADYQDMAARTAAKELEFVWRGSSSFGDAAQVFTSNYFAGNYGPPGGFWWEWGGWDEPMMDDVDLDGYNVDALVETFVRDSMAVFSNNVGNDILFMMGSDFQYTNAHVWYKNLDKLIHYVNKDGRLNVFYSTPAEYVRAKFSYNASWPLKCDDFFPYAHAEKSYWTGYFTTRPTSKAFIRASTSYLNAARQIDLMSKLVSPSRGGDDGGDDDALVDGGNSVFSRRCSVAHCRDGANAADDGTCCRGAGLRRLWEAVALTQHHDSITGTEKQHVADDYHRRLSEGMVEAEEVVNSALSAMVADNIAHRRVQRECDCMARRGKQANVFSPPCRAVDCAEHARVLRVVRDRNTVHVAQHMHGIHEARERDAAASSDVGVGGDVALQWSQCALLNVSICEATVSITRANGALAVLLYNPLAQSRDAWVQVPAVLLQDTVCVTGPDGEVVVAQAVRASDATKSLQQTLARVGVVDNDALLNATSDVDVVFQAKLPAMGYAVYVVNVGSTACRAVRRAPRERATMVTADVANNATVVSNGKLQLTYDNATGLLTSWTDVKRNVTVDVKHDVLWYGDRFDIGQRTGAYVSRPNSPQLVNGGVAAMTVECSGVDGGDEVVEVRQSFGDWVTFVTRLRRHADAVEMEWTVGPLPTDDTVEIVSRFTTSINSGDEWRTDANGREMMLRKRDYRSSWTLQVNEPVAANYYPMTAAASMNDSNIAFGIVTDRSQGVASLESGQLQVMLHRMTKGDDDLGVGENVRETMCGCRDCDCTRLIARGKHMVYIAPISQHARMLRTLQQHMNDPPIMAFAKVPTPQPSAAVAARTADVAHAWSALEVELPPNVHVLTIMRWRHDTVLLRLAHLYQVGEHEHLSKPVDVDLTDLFPHMEISNIDEVSLSGNQLKRRVHPLQWLANDSPIGQPNRVGCQGAAHAFIPPAFNWTESSVATLGPMDVRTFLVEFEDDEQLADVVAVS